MAGQYDVGVSSSAASGAQSGNTRTGDLNVTYGGGKGLLPLLTPDKAWIAWAVVGVVVVLGLALFFKFKFGK